MSDNGDHDEFLADDLLTDYESVLGVRFRGDGSAAVQLIPFGADPDTPPEVVAVSAATGHALLASLKAYRQRQETEAAT